MRTFLGGSAFVRGVPARDLTDDEWVALPKETQAAAASLYVETKPVTPPEAPEKESRHGRK